MYLRLVVEFGVMFSHSGCDFCSMIEGSLLILTKELKGQDGDPFATRESDLVTIEKRWVAIQVARQNGRCVALAGADPAHSQDFLYDADGLPG